MQGAVSCSGIVKILSEFSFSISALGLQVKSSVGSSGCGRLQLVKLKHISRQINAYDLE